MRGARVLALAALVLGLCGVILVVLAPTSALRRLANLDLGGSGFRDTYLVFNQSDPERGYVVSRHASTLRRDDEAQQGKRWQLFRIPGGESGRGRWLVQPGPEARSAGQGSGLFVPVDDVPDWTYPFLYEFVRARHPELGLPEVRWTQLYANRVYEGLYLRVALPFDARANESGEMLREILSVRGQHASLVDTDFEDDPGLYLERFAAGSLPALRDPAAPLALLARASATRETILLLSNAEPWDLTLLPLPVSLEQLFEARRGRPPAGFEDERFARWIDAGWRTAAARSPFGGAERAELEAGFADYADSFRAALHADAGLRGDPERARAIWSQRQGALAALGLAAGELR